MNIKEFNCENALQSYHLHLFDLPLQRRIFVFGLMSDFVQI